MPRSGTQRCWESIQSTLSEHSEYFNLIFLLYEDQHVFGKEMFLKDIMYACIILHNIIVKDERDAYESLFDFNYDDGPARHPNGWSIAWTYF